MRCQGTLPLRVMARVEAMFQHICVYIRRLVPVAIADFQEGIGVRERIIVQPHRCASENDELCKVGGFAQAAAHVGVRAKDNGVALPALFSNRAENGVVQRFSWTGNGSDILCAKPLAFFVKSAEHLQAMVCPVHEQRHRIGVHAEHFKHFKAYVVAGHMSIHRLDKNIHFIIPSDKHILESLAIGEKHVVAVPNPLSLREEDDGEVKCFFAQ